MIDIMRGKTKYTGKRWQQAKDVQRDFDEIADFLQNAEPVVHGHWASVNADESGYAAIYRCSVCQREISLGYFDTDCDHEYCLHCGARMDEQ